MVNSACTAGGRVTDWLTCTDPFANSGTETVTEFELEATCASRFRPAPIIRPAALMLAPPKNSRRFRFIDPPTGRGVRLRARTAIRPPFYLQYVRREKPRLDLEACLFQEQRQVSIGSQRWRMKFPTSDTFGGPLELHLCNSPVGPLACRVSWAGRRFSFLAALIFFDRCMQPIGQLSCCGAAEHKPDRERF